MHLREFELCKVIAALHLTPFLTHVIYDMA